MNLKESGLRWYWLAVIVFILDQLTKWTITTKFTLGESISVASFFNITSARNMGAAFSFLSDAGGWQKWLFALFAIGFTVVLTYFLSKSRADEKWTNISYTLIIGGALGNLFDRLYYGFVIDFLDFFWGTKHYPTFNLADTAICVGAVLMIITSGKKEK